MDETYTYADMEYRRIDGEWHEPIKVGDIAHLADGTMPWSARMTVLAIGKQLALVEDADGEESAFLLKDLAKGERP